MSPLVHVDGRRVRLPLAIEADVVIVGSGPAGAAVARRLAAAGVDVAVLEEGFEATPETFEASGVRALARLYRDMGTSIAFGRAPMPFLQGRAVGGTSVVNGAICWRFSRETLDDWVRADPALRDALPWESLERVEDEIEERLGLRATDAAVAGPKTLLLGAGAEALGIAHRPIRRNVGACAGEGRCLQGCPHGHKLSMDRTFLRDAADRSARIFAGVRVRRVVIERGRAVGVSGRSAAGGAVVARARRAVVLAASAIQTPCLLLASGLGDAAVGRNLTAHPGVSVTARFDAPVRNYRGATQGHEVTGWRDQGLKLEALGFDLSILASRVPGVAGELARHIDELDHFAVWGAAVRAQSRGRVRSGPARALVTYSLGRDDMVTARRGARVLAETFFAAGAREVYPGIAGFPAVLPDPRRAADIERDAPLEPRAYAMSMTHLFGTARMGSDPGRSVVRPDFRHHRVDRLYVADSSVFPGNLGVNPQVPIMAIATLCAERILVPS
ncbi:MAG: GMC family oxidoreductase [Deltaproteobacteria bacterium]|nr:GMC family oxidoreductase [Deltaproteobacteria bacterium]